MCKTCNELNTEKEKMEITCIKLERAGHFNYSIPIIHCPVCGTVLNKYKTK